MTSTLKVTINNLIDSLDERVVQALRSWHTQQAALEGCLPFHTPAHSVDLSCPRIPRALSECTHQ